MACCFTRGSPWSMSAKNVFLPPPLCPLWKSTFSIKLDYGLAVWKLVLSKYAAHCWAGSCKTPHPGSQTYVVGLLVPIHCIFCDTNHTRCRTIYNFIARERLQTYWTNKSTSLWACARSFTPPQTLCPHLTKPLLLADVLYGRPTKSLPIYSATTHS